MFNEKCNSFPFKIPPKSFSNSPWHRCLWPKMMIARLWSDQPFDWIPIVMSIIFMNNTRPNVILYPSRALWLMQAPASSKSSNYPQISLEGSRGHWMTISLAQRGQARNHFGPFAPLLHKPRSHFANRASLCPTFSPYMDHKSGSLCPRRRFHTFTSVHRRRRRAEKGTLACKMSGHENALLLVPFPSPQPH